LCQRRTTSFSGSSSASSCTARDDGQGRL
jgi:hypothetical protein